MGDPPYPPPPPGVQEPPCARTAPWFRGRIFHITFFCQGNGFFMVLVDVGQLFRCAGQHFMCVAMGPRIRGDPISQSQSHMPLKPPPPHLLSTPCPKQPAPDKETNKSQTNTVEHWILPCTLEGTLQPSQLRFSPLVFICQCG